jgi:hypothetical protein
MVTRTQGPPKTWLTTVPGIADAAANPMAPVPVMAW